MNLKSKKIARTQLLAFRLPSYCLSFIQVVADVVNVVNSLLQWEPENIMVTSSSMLVGLIDTAYNIIFSKGKLAQIIEVVCCYLKSNLSPLL